MSEKDDLGYEEVVKRARERLLPDCPTYAWDDDDNENLAFILAYEELLRRPLIPGAADGSYLTHLETEVKRLQKLCDMKQNLTGEVAALKKENSRLCGALNDYEEQVARLREALRGIRDTTDDAVIFDMAATALGSNP